MLFLTFVFGSWRFTSSPISADAPISKPLTIHCCYSTLSFLKIIYFITPFFAFTSLDILVKGMQSTIKLQRVHKGSLFICYIEISVSYPFFDEWNESVSFGLQSLWVTNNTTIPKNWHNKLNSKGCTGWTKTIWILVLNFDFHFSNHCDIKYYC